MKRTTQGKDIYLNHNDVPASINLGADFCAEHEWGIAGIKADFGTELNNKNGIEHRRITKLPPLTFVQDKNYFFLTSVSGRYHDLTEEKVLDSLKVIHKNRDKVIYPLFMLLPSFDYVDPETRKYYRTPKISKDWSFSSAWDKDEFAILASKEKTGNFLPDLYDAFMKLDVAIHIAGTGGNPFARGGLCLSIISRLPEHLLKVMEESDINAKKLEKASRQTGIVQKIDRINKQAKKDNYLLWNPPKGYYALSPRWNDFNPKKPSKYDVIYWLNPMNQKDNEYGWFTVEELEQWLEDKGPVIKNAKQPA